MRKRVYKFNEKRFFLKFLLCLIYLMVITVLFICSYRLYMEKDEVKPWGLVKTNEDYSYIEVSKMSEAFAYYEQANKQIHFVIEKEDTGLWHTYLIAISSDDYNKYKEIIDYTYERTTDDVSPVRVYGYPVIIDDDLKTLAIKNINNFIPVENEVNITSDNFEKYLTNSYLDTTIPKKDKFNLYVTILFLLLIIMVFLFVFTIFISDKTINKFKDKLKK